jgi:hypothetical protein
MRPSHRSALLAACTVLACTVLWVGAAHAVSPVDRAVTGKELTDLCKSEMAPNAEQAQRKPGSPQWQCRSYIQGYFEAVRWLNQESDIRSPATPPGLRPAGCMRLPDFVSFTDLAKIVVDYGESHPEAANVSGSELMQRALQDRYPCPAKPPGQTP